MAISASIYYRDGFFEVYADRLGSRRSVAASPLVPAASELPPLSFIWATDELSRGRLEFLGVMIDDLDALDEPALPTLGALGLPRVVCPTAELFDVEVADVLRWAKRTFHGQEAACEVARRAMERSRLASRSFALSRWGLARRGLAVLASR